MIETGPDRPLREELYRLASDVIWGEPSVEDVRQLESLVIKSPDARRIYAEFICDTCNLQAYAARNAPDALLIRATPLSLSPPTTKITHPQSRRLSPVLGLLHDMLQAGGRLPLAISAIVLALGAVVLSVFFLTGGGDRRNQRQADPATVVAQGAKEAETANHLAAGGRENTVAAGTANQLTTASNPPAARLTHTIDCVWADNANAPRSGDSLAARSRLELRSGVAEILFSDGSRGLLKGPASLEIRSGNAACLFGGALTVDNPLDTNFDLNTPGMKYSLNSAEFAVDVASAGVQEVHVFRGRVAAAKILEGLPGRGPAFVASGSEGVGRQPGTSGHRFSGKTAQPIEIAANEAYRIGASDKPFERFSADQNRFLRGAQFSKSIAGAMQPPLPGDFLRWKEAAQRLAKDRDLIAFYDFQRDDGAPNVLRNRAASGEKLDGRIEDARWVQGRWPAKGALNFGGRTRCVRVDIPGRFEVVTAAAWVSVHGVTFPYASIIGSNSWHQRIGQCQWHIVFNGMLEMAPCFSTTPGPPKISEVTASAKAVLAASDRDAWCYLVTVYDSRANTVTYYKNGQPIGTTHPATHLVPLEFGPSEIGNWDPESGDKAAVRFLQGRIDELMLMSRALSETEIMDLYESGKRDVEK